MTSLTEILSRAILRALVALLRLIPTRPADVPAPLFPGEGEALPWSHPDADPLADIKAYLPPPSP